MNIEELNEKDLKEIKRAFTIFMMKLVKHSSFDFLRKERLRVSRNLPLEEDIVCKVSLSNYDDGTFCVEIKNDFNNLEKVMTKEKHQKAISKLTQREKQIISLIYIEEKSIGQVAKILNITTKTVANTKNNALNKLKKDMEE